MMRFDEPSTSLDWASIEPVFFGNAVGETDLIERFEAGEDLYLPVAAAAGVPRKTAKVVLLAQLYGQSVGSLAAGLGRSEDDTAEIVDAVMSKMPEIRRITKRIKNACSAIGLVQTLSGRVLPIPLDPRAVFNGRKPSHMGYLGVNYYVQGSCYDLLAEALYEMHHRGLDDALGMAVHDELVVATEAADEIELIMCTPPPALIELAGRVPKLRTGRVDMGHHWIEKG
jgi:DNA polymerase-1